MRWIHRATLTALGKPEENIESVREGILALVPFNLSDAKITLDTQNAEGFDYRTIKIYTLTLTKEAHTNELLQFLIDTLTSEQKQTLIQQAESRLDTEFDFFIRFDKTRWIDERKLELTDSGQCFHLKLSLAVYPKNRENALSLVRKLFAQKNI